MRLNRGEGHWRSCTQREPCFPPVHPQLPQIYPRAPALRPLLHRRRQAADGPEAEQGGRGAAIPRSTGTDPLETSPDEANQSRWIRCG
jgi:hypothetical protein